jgi:hypothetical protein
VGGTWVYWTQPHVWSELKRYGLDRELKQTTGTSPDLEALYFKSVQTDVLKRYTFDGPGGYNESSYFPLRCFLPTVSGLAMLFRIPSKAFTHFELFGFSRKLIRLSIIVQMLCTFRLPSSLLRHFQFRVSFYLEEVMLIPRTSPVMETALYKFLDVDGAGGTKLLARPYDRDFVRNIPVKYFNMTCKDRLDELPDVPQEHRDLVASMFETIGCAPIDVTPFFEILRWFGLSGFTFRGFLESVDALSLKRGTTSLALAIMEESRADILLSAPVKSVVRGKSEHITTITTRNDKKFLARRVICTLPVNCLGDGRFSPSLFFFLQIVSRDATHDLP